MRKLKCCGNTDNIKYNLFWEYCISVMDLGNESGAHHCRKSAADTDKTTNVSFAPGLISIPHIFQSNIDLLEKEGKVKDT